ncbi:MAG: 2-oxoglutarate/2-oxoacid ferredoxin oxidoreductase subunit alpha [Syntrophus sp. SKADARSKE-3]|nr:2-oxoglutarate/2-oxoacid ferredoxin oxidoreductase subunit alpha [Syntrophus sp. SKADARSKE-3]
MEFNLIIGGEAGQGAFSVEVALADILVRLHYYFFATKNYMSRVRGGHNFHMFRIADHPVHALNGGLWDMVVALDEETERRHQPKLREKGIYLSKTFTEEIGHESREIFHDVTVANTILVGMILSVIGTEAENLSDVLDAKHMEYVMHGFKLASQHGLSGVYPVPARAGNQCSFDGNKAVAIGAFLGGCQFMAGYPMTPSTSIMYYFATAAVSAPAHFEQAEDEISAINMVIGASYGGLRSMVATSGGGFALMQEGVSLVGMTETPVVIVVGQRPGPATGLPTRTEQGDLNFVLHSGHGEFPRIIFAPRTIEEAITLTRKSFDLADQYQIPVFILTDQYFADSMQVLEDNIPLEVLARKYSLHDLPYRRYALTETGISPLTYPGLSEALVRVDSDEHDEDGKITEDLELRVRMVDKRRGKMLLLKNEAVMPTFSGKPNADTIVLSWGSNRLIVEEAIHKLSDEEIHLSALHFGQVYPLVREMIAPYGLESKMIICVENNAGGQFAGLLKREFGLNVTHSVLKYSGECFTVSELQRRFKKLLS